MTALIGENNTIWGEITAIKADNITTNTRINNLANNTYTNGSGIDLTGSTFSIILTWFQARFIELTDSFGGEVSGTYNNIVIGNDVLDDQYYDSEGDLTTLHADRDWETC